jgi:hypothetical protein
LITTDFAIYSAGAASIVKTTYLVALSAKADFTCTFLAYSYVPIHNLISFAAGELAPLLIWAAVEDGLAITAASIPALKPLLVRIFPSSDSDNYDMISYPPLPGQNGLSNSQGKIKTDIGHTTLHDPGSQTAILEPVSPKGETINMTTEVSVTYGNTI